MTTIQHRGIQLTALFIVAVALWLLLTGCGTSEPALCAQVHAGGLMQTSDDPITFSIIVNRDIVATDVPLAAIMECK